jgi:predicted transcriptional regulator
MSSKSTVAISVKTRIRLKKLAAYLNKTQTYIVEQALRDFERKVLNLESDDKLSQNDTEFVEKILKEATKEVWESDPVHKALQEKLLEGKDTIDDYIIQKWDPGFEDDDEL